MKDKRVFRELRDGDIEYALGLIQTLRENTTVWDDHADPGSVEDCWNSLDEIVGLMALLIKGRQWNYGPDMELCKALAGVVADAVETAELPDVDFQLEFKGKDPNDYELVLRVKPGADGLIVPALLLSTEMVKAKAGMKDSKVWRLPDDEFARWLESLKNDGDAG